MKYPNKVKYVGKFECYNNKEEGRYYVVTFPDVKGCVTQGRTFKEAIEMSKDALALMLGVYVEHKEQFPEFKFKFHKNTKRIKTKEIILSIEEIVETLPKKGL